MRRAATLAILLLIPGHLLSQAPGPSTVVPAMLPLKQTSYIKASNAEAYDAHLEDGADNSADDSGAAYLFDYLPSLSS